MATCVDDSVSVCAGERIGRPQVLVIDDEPRVIDGLKRQLNKHNLDVLEGYHGYHGIWRGITERPDAIITDIKMPHADGEEVIECLQRNPSTRGVPIFVLTGVSDPDLERRLRSSGIAGYFTKPADVNELLSALSKFVGLGKHQAHELSEWETGRP